MADEHNESPNSDSAKMEQKAQEVSAETHDSNISKEGENSTDNQTEGSKTEPDSSDIAEQNVAEKNSPPLNEEAKSTNETTETENEQANTTATADESSNDEPKDQSSDQPPDQPSDQSNDPPTEGHDGIQENPHADDGVEVEGHSATPKAEEPDNEQATGADKQGTMHLQYEPIIEEEEEERTLKLDMKISSQEFLEESNFMDDGESFRNREFPDAYSTPPPHDRIPEENESEGYGDEQKEDSDGESSPELPVFDRAQLLEKYKEVREERVQLQNFNNQLQHKLAEYFKKKKTDERAQEIEKSVTDQEQRYLKYISNLQELQHEEVRQLEEMKAQKEDMKQRCFEKQEKVKLASDEFVKFKHDIAKSAINSRSGKPIPPKDSETLQTLEFKKEEEVRQVRLDNIKLKNKLRKKELLLKAKEELAEGLHLIDFEQLKIENQTYNEKIEERNEEILKLRKKITTTVQVLTHLKEKLQFVQGENAEQRTRLRNIDAIVAQKRDVLTRTKQVRDALRIDNLKLKQKCGLLGNESLLRDFEVRKEEGDDLAKRLTELKTNHTGLSMNLNGVKKKLTQARIHSA